jgi:hypothetical protein
MASLCSDSFFFHIGLWRRQALAFLKDFVQQKQIDHKIYIWNQADYVGLLRFQVGVRFYFPRAEFYREITRPYDDSHYSICVLWVTHPRIRQFRFTLLHGASRSCFAFSGGSDSLVFLPISTAERPLIPSLTQSHLKRHLRHERWHRQINSI